MIFANAADKGDPLVGMLFALAVMVIGGIVALSCALDLLGASVKKLAGARTPPADPTTHSEVPT